jgi:putative membrane-bound dehydrogenase-like protein
MPRVLDPRLQIRLFASAPDIVHPIALDVDGAGRLLVVESHTHFRPPNYQGPRFDRIRCLQDSDGDGHCDKVTTFYEGTTATMDLATHWDGSVYLATRNAIWRLRDQDGDGRADIVQRLVILETAGNYPHNGLCGLCFDSRGDLWFGMGENLGEPYRLIGADGVVWAGGGEGGNVFHCTANGHKLRRVATGFWNPFGIGRDVFDHIMVVDNDPDASPPCRLLHLVDGGDYSFQFRYGRAGRHPFQAWNGELPGTLPYICGTGEAPCEALCYESDGLPDEYRGRWLVPTWADHRVESYSLRPRGASFAAERTILVQGDSHFYPAGIAIASDGSIFVSDWGSRSYELHGRGAIWWVGNKVRSRVDRPMSARAALASADRRTREAAARQLCQSAEGRQLLRDKLNNVSVDIRIRATALSALAAHGEAPQTFAPLLNDPHLGIRTLALQQILQGDPLPKILNAAWLQEQPAPLVAIAVADPRFPLPEEVGRALLTSADPFLRHAAIMRLARDLRWQQRWRNSLPDRAEERLALLLAERHRTDQNRLQHLRYYLQDTDPQVRLLALKWVSDETLVDYRDDIAATLGQADLNPRDFLAVVTALARLDGKAVNEQALAEYFLQRIHNQSTPIPLRLAALRALPANHRSLAPELLLRLLSKGSSEWKVEVLRLLKDRGDRKVLPSVAKLASDSQMSTAVRCQALVTLSALTDRAEFFLLLVDDPDEQVAEEALRALTGLSVSEAQRQQLQQKVERRPALQPLWQRLVDPSRIAKNRPAPTDTTAWLKLLEGTSRRDVGRRVFESPRLAGCYRCHLVEGRGNSVGPDLSLIGRTERTWILESLLQPSAVVAPRYQAWRITTTDERSRLGILVGTHYDEAEYVDEQGRHFRVRTSDVVDLRAVPQSLMPDQLLNTLTDQEIRDLLAYLTSLR